MTYSKIKRHLLVFAILLLATRTLFVPCWALQGDIGSDKITLKAAAHQLIEFSSHTAPDFVVEIKAKEDSSKIKYQLAQVPACITVPARDRLQFRGAVLGRSNGLRAPPRPLWLLNRVLLI